MSEGRSTQRKMDLMMWASLAGWAVFLVLFFVVPGTRTLAYLVFLLLVPLYLGQILMRCKACKHHVSREADGSRSSPGWRAKVNPRCTKCGAEIA